MLMLIIIALPGTDADTTDLVAPTTSRYKEHTREDDFAYASCDATRWIHCTGFQAGVIIDLATASNPYRGSTSGNPNEQGFSYVLGPGHGIAIGQTSTSFHSMHTLRHGGQYPGKVLVACVDAADESPIEFLNDGVKDVTLYFIVDAYSSGEAGAFTLEWLLYTVGQDRTKDMSNLWPEPRPGRVLNTYTPLTDSNIKTAAQLWVSNQASATSTYGLVNTWDLSQVTSLANVWCGSSESTNCGSAYLTMRSFNADISMWDVSKVTTMYQSKSIRIFENDLA
jgi:surface protein